jgi:POT family proton-dependent oligopeptide transporter
MLTTIQFAPNDVPDRTSAEKRDSVDKHDQQATSALGEEFVAEEGFEAPTPEELLTLRRVSDKIPFKAYTIAFVELVERLSYYGTTQVRARK